MEMLEKVMEPLVTFYSDPNVLFLTKTFYFQTPHDGGASVLSSELQ